MLEALGRPTHEYVWEGATTVETTPNPGEHVMDTVDPGWPVRVGLEAMEESGFGMVVAGHETAGKKNRTE